MLTSRYIFYHKDKEGTTITKQYRPLKNHKSCLLLPLLRSFTKKTKTTMSNIKTFLLAMLAIITFQTASAQKIAWKELQDFHTVMAATFHPTEEGNMAPLKEKSGDLLAKAKTWQASPVPAGFKKDETTAVLTKLVAQCDLINRSVAAKADDAELKREITTAHEIFHTIVEKCRAPETEKK
jgi:hypothetical protein